MKLAIEETLPNGRPASRRYWGVSFHPEKRQLKAAYRPQVVGKNADGTPITDEDSPTHDLRLQHLQERLAWGDPDESAETVTAAMYITRIRLLDKQRHVGTATLPQVAARLYDSALYYCWGFSKRPKPHFNFYRPADADSIIPVLLPKVKDLQFKLKLECRTLGLDYEAFNYTFAQRNDF